MAITDMLRLAPMGPFVGDPGLRVGPGSVGVIARAHGVATATALFGIATSLPQAIPGLGETAGGTIAPFTVDMRPGYLYQLDMHTRVESHGLTTDVAVTPYFRLHYATANAWGAWTQVSPYPIVLKNTALTTDADPSIEASDALYGLSVTANVDRIEFGVIATETDIWCYSPRSFATVTEYIPAPTP